VQRWGGNAWRWAINAWWGGVGGGDKATHGAPLGIRTHPGVRRDGSRFFVRISLPKEYAARSMLPFFVPFKSYTGPGDGVTSAADSRCFAVPKENDEKEWQRPSDCLPMLDGKG
jgi:hypothetical protein